MTTWDVKVIDSITHTGMTVPVWTDDPVEAIETVRDLFPLHALTGLNLREDPRP